MSLFDAFEFLDFLDILISWRFFLPAAIGVGAALAVYHLSGETPASAAVAFAIGFAGLCTGIVWQVRHERRG